MRESANRVFQNVASQLFLAILAVCTVVGCAGRKSTPNAEGPYGTFLNAGEHEVTGREYRVDPPDEIQISATNIKELDGQHETVRPDGKITLELLHEELFVAGMTPREIATHLTQIAEKTCC
jgi:protein involved in polysaccharide export with SLBB domain